MKRAADICINENKSERSIAAKFGICHVSLNRFIKKLKTHHDSGGPPPECGYHPHTQIFNILQESMLSQYLKNCADMYFGYQRREKTGL